MVTKDLIDDVASKARLSKKEAEEEVERLRKAAEAEKARLDAEEKLRPDREKIRSYLTALEAVPLPDVSHPEAQELVADFVVAWKQLVNVYLVK